MTDRQLALRQILKEKNRVRLKKELNEQRLVWYNGTLMRKIDSDARKAADLYNAQRRKMYNDIHKLNPNYIVNYKIPQTMCAMQYYYHTITVVTNSRVTCAKCKEMMQ